MEAANVEILTYKPPIYPTIDATQAKAIATGLVNAQNPRIAVGRLRTPQGVKLAIELAELVGATTSTSATGGPMSFPQRHPLCGGGADTTYDYTLGLETNGAQASLVSASLGTITADRDTAHIGFSGIQGGGGGRGGGGRGGGAAAGPALDAEASLPSIIEQVKLQLTADKMRTIADRTAKH